MLNTPQTRQDQRHQLDSPSPCRCKAGLQDGDGCLRVGGIATALLGSSGDDRGRLAPLVVAWNVPGPRAPLRSDSLHGGGAGWRPRRWRPYPRICALSPIGHDGTSPAVASSQAVSGSLGAGRAPERRLQFPQPGTATVPWVAAGERRRRRAVRTSTAWRHDGTQVRNGRALVDHSACRRAKMLGCVSMTAFAQRRAPGRRAPGLRRRCAFMMAQPSWSSMVFITSTS